MERYDIAFIGAGPSTFCAVLKLIEDNYQGKICIIDQGSFIEKRDKKEIIKGYGGAGVYSDGKCTSSLTVGGIIPGLTQQEFDDFETYFLALLNKFKQKTKYKDTMKWINTNKFDTKDSSLIWDTHHVNHMGTECTQAIYLEMEKFIRSQPNIICKDNTEVIDIDYKHDSCYIDCAYEIITKDNVFYSDKLVLATGRFGTLPAKVMKKFDLKLTPRVFSLGIRVEDQINSQYEEIIKASYDFKFIKEYSYPNKVKCRVRTFCCNSGNAHTAVEKSKEFSSFNGHSFKTPDPNNHSVNYGIVCEISGLTNLSTKEEQIELMKKVNSLPTWKKDNLDKNNNPDPKRKLLDGFEFLRGTYPDEVIDSLTDFVKCLNKVVNLSEAKFLYPEIKMSDMIPHINYKTFETGWMGLYMIGDCCCTGSIVKSSLTGYYLAKYLKPNEYF